MDDGDLNDLFGAFDGDDVAETVEPVAPPPVAPAVAAKRKSMEQATNGNAKKGKQKKAEEEEEEEDDEEDEEGGGGGGERKRPRKSDGGEGDPGPNKGVQPTITQHQEIITPDGRRVISFSALPADYVANPDFVPPAKPAKEYPFPLDPFQQAAIGFIEKGESVLVAAHTSAGKTVTAEVRVSPTHPPTYLPIHPPTYLPTLSTVCDRHEPPEEAAGDLHQPHQGPLQSEVPRHGRGVWRRRAHDGR